MAQRKLQIEIDKTFKKVAEGVAAFESIYEKIYQSSNASQKEKLEDALKKEIKKLQRSRDQIKAWAQMNDIKDKKPLLDHRKLIETQMEKFKAVEKEMKTKAYSKEGLSNAMKLDPKEKEKLEACQFLSNMVDEIDRQIEMVEAEHESLHANLKKGKKDTAKADRIAELERINERHKWHQGKLELLLRALENGQVETDQVMGIEDSIKYYVENNQEVDFMEDDSIYDDFNLEEEEDLYGMGNEVDRVSSHDAQSIHDDAAEGEGKSGSAAAGKQKAVAPAEPSGPAARRPSMHLKSPLPALATLHTNIPSSTNGTSSSSIKPAPLPTRAPGEPLKYASAAAAAAASDKNNVGIAPLPPPPNAALATTGIAPLPSATALRTVSGTAQTQQPPAVAPPSLRHAASTSDSGDVSSATQDEKKSPAPTQLVTTSPFLESKPAADRVDALPSGVNGGYIEDNSGRVSANKARKGSESAAETAERQQTVNGDARSAEDNETQSVYALPSSLLDLIDSFESAKSNVASGVNPSLDRLFTASHATCPESIDAERPRHYKPSNPYPYAPAHYPQEPLPIFDDPRLYSRLDIDTLFYTFYFRQGTYEQYLAAKALKSQSWRFHKQYQTWFQRHEEPKAITEEYEQGTYRFFDYESTWMNRRKADFKFAYKFLEDDF